jgi:group I intron endonuclease
MIGIYKITNPKGKIYIGQSVDIRRRKRVYETHNCKGQVRLYASIKKYGFNNHLFEVIEECNIEYLNERERYWQDFYNVLQEGLNCMLTELKNKPGKLSEESIEKKRQSRINFNQTEEGRHKLLQASINRKKFYNTPEGIECRERQIQSRKEFLNSPKGKESLKQQAESRKNFNQTPKGREVLKKQAEKLKTFLKTPEGRLSRAKGVSNTDWNKKVQNTDYSSFQNKRVSNMDWESKAKKCMKPILQFEKNGTLVGEWESGKEAGESLKIHPTNISACCKGKAKSAGGFIWKYKNI